VHELLRANLLDDELPGVDERERHQALAIEFGIPPIVAGLTYSSIAGGSQASFAGSNSRKSARRKPSRALARAPPAAGRSRCPLRRDFRTP
jgi:hypothetical protein